MSIMPINPENNLAVMQVYGFDKRITESRVHGGAYEDV